MIKNVYLRLSLAYDTQLDNIVFVVTSNINFNFNQAESRSVHAVEALKHYIRSLATTLDTGALANRLEDPAEPLGSTSIGVIQLDPILESNYDFEIPEYEH